MLPTKRLELGSKIVRDLGLEYSVDTLARWMSHHLAEKILSLQAQEGDDRRPNEKEVEDLIIKLWKNRYNWPNGVTPLNQLDSLKSLLIKLSPDSSPFTFHSNDELEKLLASTVFALKQTIVQGALMLSETRTLPIDQEFDINLFSKEEQIYISTVYEWVNFAVRRPNKTSYEDMLTELELEKDDIAEKELEVEDLLAQINTDIELSIEGLKKLKVKLNEEFSPTSTENVDPVAD